MPTLHNAPTIIEAAGSKPKVIREHIGCVNSENAAVSIAHMQSPSGWEEPGQRPEFDEYTVVLRGELSVHTESGDIINVRAGQAITVRAGEWIRYATPGEEGCEYIAVCIPAFTPNTVHRDDE